MPSKKKSNSNGTRKWIHQLHTRSWEMELLIVGFALLVLLRVPDSLGRQIDIWESRTTHPLLINIISMASILVLGAKIMTFNLIIHLLLINATDCVDYLHCFYTDLLYKARSL